MRKICFILLIGICINFIASENIIAESKNPYIPKEINLWLDQEFLKLFQCQPSNEVIYSTNIDEKALLRQLVELNRLQLQINLMLLKQNERIIELLQKLTEKQGMLK